MGSRKKCANLVHIYLTCFFLRSVFSRAHRKESCADPGSFSVGVSRPDSQKTVWAFLLLLFLKSSTYLTFYRGGPTFCGGRGGGCIQGCIHASDVLES